MPEQKNARARTRYAAQLAQSGLKPNDRNRSRSDTQGKEAVGSWLFVHYDYADQGARPVPSGDTFWESPDIWIEGGDVYGNAIPGKPVTVWTRIWNAGYMKAFGTQVDFAFVDPSLGIPWTSPQAIGAKPSFVTVPECILGPGCAEISSLAQWVPDMNSTHACLLVMCRCALWNDVPTQLWSPVNDRHVAQHNVTITAAYAGQVLSFQLHTANITPVASTVQIGAQVAWVNATSPRDALRYSSLGVRNGIAALNQPIDLQQMRAMASRTSRLLELGTGVPGTSVELGQLREVVRIDRMKEAGRATNGAIVIPSRTAVRGLNGYTPIDAPVFLKPLERRVAHLEIRVPQPPAGARQLLVRIAQFENEYATGGYTVVLDIDPGKRGQDTLQASAGTAANISVQPQQGATMNAEKSDIQSFVIEQHGEARITFQVACQLAGHVPIESMEKLKGTVKEIVVDNKRLPLAMFEPYLTREMFPIENAQDLVRKLSAMIRTTLSVVRQSDFPITDSSVRSLLANDLLSEPGRRAPIPAGHFTGPSIFGSTRAKGE